MLGYIIGSIARVFGFLDGCDKIRNGGDDEMQDKIKKSSKNGH